LVAIFTFSLIFSDPSPPTVPAPGSVDAGTNTGTNTEKDSEIVALKQKLQEMNTTTNALNNELNTLKKQPQTPELVKKISDLETKLTNVLSSKGTGSNIINAPSGRTIEIRFL
jgi:hypothetical protein